MNPSPFIFSNERKYRLQRHIVFWVAWWLFMAVLYAYFIPIQEDYNGYFRYQLPVSLVNALLYMPAHMFLTYSLIYFIIPRYLVKGKYVLSAVLVMIAFLLTAALSNLIYSGLVNRVNHIFFPNLKGVYVAHRGNMYITLLAGLRGGITVGGIGAAIKLMKYFYFKEQRNLQLQKENMESQLQVLKAQIHPHFLFNTMNNIYSYTQNTSPEASRMIMGLSDILRYMLYDCNHPTVSLAKELKIESQVEFAGWVSGQKKDDLFNNASIFCLPSYAEGFPMAILDAMSYSIPVVATPVGGITDVFQDNYHLLIFPPGNIQELSNKLKILINDSALRKDLVAHSSLVIKEKFELSRVVAKINDLYLLLMSKAG